MEATEGVAARKAPTSDRREKVAASRTDPLMALVVTGLLNKQVGFELGISQITVKAHRGQVMRKMKAGSLPELANMAARLNLAQSPHLS